jgi:predicted Zn-dependent peptidase
MLAVALCLLGLAPTARAGHTLLALPTTRYVLPSGMVVILHEDHRLPTVVVSLGFAVGSADERPGHTGFAHLFEHLMFMGTERVPTGEFDRIMETAGGQNNAQTSTDRTSYVDWGPAHLLETFLWLESDRLASLPQAMTGKKLALQRDVVENERRENIENRPYGVTDVILPDKLFPPGHPYHHPVIGSHADLHAARVADVKDFFARYYVPANAVLVVSGDFSVEDARRLVEKYFGAMAPGQQPPHVDPPVPSLPRELHVEVRDDVPVPRLVLAWISPPDYAPGDAECDLMAAILGGGRSSRLYRSLVYERKLAQSVEALQESARLGSQLVVTVTAQPGHTAAELERAVNDELVRLEREPPTESELGRARDFVQTETLHDLSEPTRLVEQILNFEQRFHDPGELGRRIVSRYDDVTLPELTRVMKAILAKPHLTLRIQPR